MGVVDFLRGFFNPKTDDTAGRSLRNGLQSLLDGKRAEDERNEQRRADWQREQDEMRRWQPQPAGADARRKENAERNAESFREENESARLAANRVPVTARAPLRGGR